MNQINLSGEPDLSMMDRIPWIELEHAYGAAVDVPDQIRALLSPDAKVRRKTIWRCYGNIFHQGSVYSATVAAIPVFQHLLQYEQVAEKRAILEMLASFAYGFTDELYENVDLAKVLRGTEDDELDADGRECYLAVGAGVPLYELLLDDADPQVAIAASFMLALFPAHAFASCHRLLAIANDRARHDYLRGSALMAISFLDGGTVRENFDKALLGLVNDADPPSEKPLPFLVAAAAYCLLRDKGKLADEESLTEADNLAICAVQYGVQLPECDFYRIPRQADVEEMTKEELEELYVPTARFPWRDVVKRLERHTSYRTKARAKRALTKHCGPDPESFAVKPDVFDRENVTAAVRRLHAHCWWSRNSIAEGTREFEPFKPHAMLAWDEVLRFLDSEKKEDRWAAANLIEYGFELLDESAVDQLIERLHRGDNNNLCLVICKQPVSERQCQMLCDRLCRGEFPQTDHSGPRDDYRRIVLQHGSLDQIWQLFHEGEFPEQHAAATVLLERGEVPPNDPRALNLFVEALLSNEYGSKMSATWTFSHSPAAQQWFLESYDSISEPHRWAVAEAMLTFRPDLSELQDALFARIEGEENPVLAAKLIDVVANFESPTPATVDRLSDLCGEDSPALVRWAVVRVLGSWLGKDIVRILGERLRAFVKDTSARVRQAAIDELAKFCDTAAENIEILRRCLSDEEPDNRRHAMWHLSYLGELTAGDLGHLFSANQPDRLTAESLIAAAINGQKLSSDARTTSDLADDNRPLTNSVRKWVGEPGE